MKRTFCVLALCLLAASPLCADNWPHWRGPSANGFAAGRKLPAEWSLEKNVVWKASLPSWSGSSPIVWEDRIFLMSPSPGDPAPQVEPSEGGRGRGRMDPGGQDLLLISFSRKDGRELWRQVVDTGNQLHRKGNNTSPSPVTDGQHVWAVTGTGTVAAYSIDGKEAWKRNLQKDYGGFGHNWGYGSSPLLHEGKLFVEVLHGMNTDDPSYLVAFDAKTGDALWRQERPTEAVRESPDAYTTPAVVRADGKTQIVVTGGDCVTGHDPATGTELWRAGGLNPANEGNYRIVASPVVAGDIVFAPSRVRPFLALRPGGTGDVTESHLLWKAEEGALPDVPTPATDGTYLYLVNDKGMVSCVQAQTGQVVWGPERTAQGVVSASPVLADGKLYVLNEFAVTTVLKSGPEFRHLATNELDGSYTLSSIAVSGSRLFVRTGTHLYCIAGDE